MPADPAFATTVGWKEVDRLLVLGCAPLNPAYQLCQTVFVGWASPTDPASALPPFWWATDSFASGALRLTLPIPILLSTIRNL
jgi:hypothetical protein